MAAAMFIRMGVFLGASTEEFQAEDFESILAIMLFRLEVVKLEIYWKGTCRYLMVELVGAAGKKGCGSQNPNFLQQPQGSEGIIWSVAISGTKYTRLKVCHLCLIANLVGI